MIRVALLGCGEHARASHAAPLARYAAAHPGEIALAAACDLNLARAEDFSREFGFERACASMDELLDARDFDACVSVMPIDRVARVGVTLLERGIPCVIEKPLGTSVDEVERLARAARETGTPHMVSVNRRFMPYLNRAVRWAGSQGTLQYARASVVRHGRSEPDFIWSTAIHAVDALRHVAGEIDDFDTRVLRRDGLSTLWYLISLRFASGAFGQIEVLPTAGFVEESYELCGEGFRARVVAGSGPQRSLHLWRGGALESAEHAAGDEPEDLLNGSYEEVVEFVRALRGGAPPRPVVDDILPSARVCFAIAESVKRQAESMP